MSVTTQYKLINLQAGEVYFSATDYKIEEPTKIKAILGSCVTVTIWHSKSKLCGMCHYLLCQEYNKISTANSAANNAEKYRYGESALDYLFKKMSAFHPINECELALFGGSNMYVSTMKPSIGDMNVAYAYTWAKKNKLQFMQEDTLGNVGRSIHLDLTNGNIEVHRYS